MISFHVHKNQKKDQYLRRLFLTIIYVYVGAGEQMQIYSDLALKAS